MDPSPQRVKPETQPPGAEVAQPNPQAEEGPSENAAHRPPEEQSPAEAAAAAEGPSENAAHRPPEEQSPAAAAAEAASADDSPSSVVNETLRRRLDDLHLTEEETGTETQTEPDPEPDSLRRRVRQRGEEVCALRAELHLLREEKRRAEGEWRDKCESILRSCEKELSWSFMEQGASVQRLEDMTDQMVAMVAWNQELAAKCDVYKAEVEQLKAELDERKAGDMK